MSRLTDALSIATGPAIRGNPLSKPLNPPVCPHCGSTDSKVVSTLRNALLGTPNIYARYHKCHACRLPFWSYTDPATRETEVRTVSPVTLNNTYRKAKKAAERSQQDVQ